MLYDEQLGHDSQLDGMSIDALAQSVSLRLSSYPSEGASDRVAIEICFTDVEQVQTLADLAELSDNRAAGNVNHWHIATGPGTSYFYLVEGCIMISAKNAPSLRSC